MRRIITVLAGVAFLLSFSSVASAASPPQPVTIVTNVDFSSFPVHGTFTVPVGSSTLGCSGGTFVDFPAHVPSGSTSINKVFTCTTGGIGDFIVNFRPCAISFDPATNTCTGNWNVTEGFDDFAGLHGSGDFTVVFDPVNPTGVETLTGKILYS